MVTNDDNVSATAEALNQEWDALVQPAATVHPGGPDSGAGGGSALNAAVRALHSRDDAPAPDPSFAARLWRDMVENAPQRDPDPVSVERAHSIGFIAPAVSLPGPLLHVAIAAAIVLAVIGSSWSDSPVFAPFAVGSPTVSAREALPAIVATAPAGLCDPSPTPQPSGNASYQTPTVVPGGGQPCAGQGLP